MSTTPTSDRNDGVIETFRANSGAMPNGANILLLHTKGAKSGQARVHPVVYTRDGDRYVVLASKGGAPTNPDWYHNLVASPNVTIEVGSQRLPARAVITQGASGSVCLTRTPW
jgi:deazaflavin-dependent oxidoreductase (nitroreductase family)